MNISLHLLVCHSYMIVYYCVSEKLDVDLKPEKEIGPFTQCHFRNHISEWEHEYAGLQLHLLMIKVKKTIMVLYIPPLFILKSLNWLIIDKSIMPTDCKKVLKTTDLFLQRQTSQTWPRAWNRTQNSQCR